MPFGHQHVLRRAAQRCGERRAGEQGQVVLVDDEGASIDFFCDVNGDPRCLPSIEFWEWGEIVPVA